MDKQSVLDPLDEPKAALRTLFILSVHSEGLNVMALYGVMKERFGVGRPATDSSYRALLGAGLVEVFNKKIEGRSLRVVKLTDRGLRAAIKIRGVVSVLQGDDEGP